MPADPARAEEVAAAARLILDPAERAAYLDRACDAGLRAEVDALLAATADTRTALLVPPDEGATGAYRPDDPTDTFTPRPHPPARASPGPKPAPSGRTRPRRRPARSTRRSPPPRAGAGRSPA